MNGILAVLLAARAAASCDPHVTLETPTPGSYRLQGAFLVQAAPEVAQAVVTDYDGIARFVSSIRSSRVLRREPGSVLIEQEGVGRFFFVTRSVTLRLDIQESAGRVEFRDAGGSPFKRYEGSWTIAPAGGGSVVTYELAAEPEGLPRFAAKRALRKSVQKLLEQVRSEMERRVREPHGQESS